MSEAHSVLFDSNEPYYQGADNLQYYQGEYSQDSSAVSPSYSYQASNSQEYDTYAYPPPAGAPQVEVSFLAALGSGGLPGEPPLLEGFPLILQLLIIIRVGYQFRAC